MLALTRRIGEQIVISDNVVITVADIKGDIVRLAFKAPKEIRIYRSEIYNEIAAENKQASSLVNLPDVDNLKKNTYTKAKIEL